MERIAVWTDTGAVFDCPACDQSQTVIIEQFHWTYWMDCVKCGQELTVNIHPKFEPEQLHEVYRTGEIPVAVYRTPEGKFECPECEASYTAELDDPAYPSFLFRCRGDKCNQLMDVAVDDRELAAA